MGPVTDKEGVPQSKCTANPQRFADGVFLYLIIFLVISCRGPPLINLKQKQIDRRKYNDYYN